MGKATKIVKDQLTFLLFGFVFWLTIAVFVYIIVFLFTNVEDVGRKF